MSKSHVPLIHEVISLIDTLTAEMEKYKDNKDNLYNPLISAAAARGFAVLNKYYSKTDESVFYRAAMCSLLHFNSAVCWLTRFLCSNTSKVQKDVYAQSKVARPLDRYRGGTDSETMETFLSPIGDFLSLSSIFVSLLFTPTSNAVLLVVHTFVVNLR